MKTRLLTVMVLAVVLVLAFATVAQAAVSQSKIDQIDGTYTAAEIRAALASLQNDPAGTQYTDYAGELEDYLASLQSPGAQTGELAFTGAPLVLLLAAGAGLVGGGVALRRRGR